MSVTISIPDIQLTPGSQIAISNISWEEFQEILEEFGETRNIRLCYYQNILEIMSPSASHERIHRIIAYIIITILEHQQRDWEDFGSTTLKYPDIAGVEPDSCFYLQNAHRARNIINLDLTQVPPPDLAIECDVTSKTAISAYQTVKVPEVWIYDEGNLRIYQYIKGEYQKTLKSLAFPDFPINEMIPYLIQQAIAQGTRQMLMELKANYLEKKMK
ncbi:MAG: hypothetical protein BRC33_08050 [Cyanobacteria bacterium SW_9_44_58]|nr:MAG: hypothetical protein BRC33_08050 [Cyanobacteria bacterium SW_9_44_58]